MGQGLTGPTQTPSFCKSDHPRGFAAPRSLEWTTPADEASRLFEGLVAAKRKRAASFRSEEHAMNEIDHEGQ